MIAFSLGFPIDAVLELERSTLSVPLDTPEQRNDYIVVRNHILATWRLDVRSWLSKSHIKVTNFFFTVFFCYSCTVAYLFIP